MKERFVAETWCPMMSILGPQICFSQDQGTPRKTKRLSNLAWLREIWQSRKETILDAGEEPQGLSM